MPAAKPTRLYQEIWDNVKKNGTCTVEVLPCFQARVKKAVFKEKNNDLGFKVLNHHDHFYLKVDNPVVNGKTYTGRLKFTLKQSLGLQGAVKDV